MKLQVGNGGFFMTDAISIAMSGLRAQSVRLAASASNIANVGTSGAIPTPEAPASTVYKPLNVSYTALSTGGVRADVIEDANGYTPVYDPSSIYANNDGLSAAPNVDLVKETVNMLEAKAVYKANVSVIKTQEEMLGELLDTLG